MSERRTFAARDRVLWLQRLYRKRIQLGLSRVDLARFIHVPRGTIKGWETRLRLPEHRMLARYEDCLKRCEQGKITYTRCPITHLLRGLDYEENREVPRHLVEKLRARREELKMTRKELSLRMGFNINSWATIERGDRKLLQVNYDKAYEILFGCPPETNGAS